MLRQSVKGYVSVAKRLSTKLSVSHRERLVAQHSRPERWKNVCAPLMDISPDTKHPVHPKTPQQQTMIEAALNNNFVFSNMESDQLDALVKAFELHEVNEPNFELIRQGDQGDFFYVVESGVIEFLVNGVPEPDAATTGWCFGELALLYDCPRAASCIVREAPCRLWRVHQDTFRQLVVSQAMLQHAQAKKVMDKVPFLSQLDISYTNRIIAASTIVKFQKGDVIVRLGDVGQVFYIILDGKATVSDIHGTGASSYVDQELGAGDYFGERALLTGSARAATITAASNPCRCLCLGQEVFQKVLGSLESLMQATNNKRCLMGIPLLSGSDLETHEFDRMTILLSEIEYKAGEVRTTTSKDRSTHLTSGIYLVQKGSIKVGDTKSHTVFKAGDFFGENLIVADESKLPFIKAEALEATVCKLLSRKSLEHILGDLERLPSIETGSMGSTGSRKVSLIRSMHKNLVEKIPLDSLEKITILGVGTFGKVWFVTDEKHRTYALKIQKKRQLIAHKQVEGVIREKEVMSSLDPHPFVIQLVQTYQDTNNLYMLLELVQGGELFSVIHSAKHKRLPEATSRFYTRNIMEGLHHMHERNILYRDLKPENILIDRDGYCVIVDLGFAKVVPNVTYTLCGTPLYLPPEVIMNSGHDKSADYWSLAVLSYEMLFGVTPFHTQGINQMALFKRICKGKWHFPAPNSRKFAKVTPECKDLIESLLVVSRHDRLGNLAGGSNDIRNHDWLSVINVEEMEAKTLKVPWKPVIKDAMDISCFDDWSLEEQQEEEDAKQDGKEPLTEDEQDLFLDFDLNF